MADFIKTVLGIGRGKVGGVMFRFINGKTVLSSLPVPRKVSTDPVVINRKKKFGLLVKFAHAVNYIYQLKYFWKAYNTGSLVGFRSAFNKIVKKNYSNVTADDLDNDIMLIPDTGFEVTKTSVTLTNADVTVVLQAIGSDKGIDPVQEINFQLALILFMKTPTLPDKDAYHFIHKISAPTLINLVNPLTFVIDLDNVEKQKFDEYSTKKAFLCLVTTDIDGKPIRYSNTISAS